MKTYEGKTIMEALNNASKDLEIPVTVLKTKANIISHKKDLFSSKYIIGIFNNFTVFSYATSYLDLMLAFLGAKATYTRNFDKTSGVITIDIQTDEGSKVIGKNGETLKALNNLTRSACFNHFGGKYRILLNCGDYKENKYAKITALVNKLAQDVEESGVPTVLNPMPADERRVVHNVILGFPDLESPSIGDGKERHIIIRKKRQ